MVAALAVLAVFLVFTAISAADPAVHASLTSSPSPATGKAPLTVVFDGSGSNSPTPLATWSLDFGDGNSTSGTGTPPSSISHDYAVGTPTATLTVTDEDGDSDTATIAVNSKANVAPTANLTSSPSPAVGLAPLGVTFHGTGSSDSDGSIASWSLDFGDGTADATGTGAPPANIPIHSYAAGSYTAILTVTDDDGATGTDSVAVKANVAPIAALSSTPSPATGKAPLSVTFNGSGSSDSDGTIASWSLAYGDGNSASGSGAPPATIGPHSYAAGNRTAVLTVTDNNGATDTESVAVTSNANVPPVAHLSASPSHGSDSAERHLQRLDEHGLGRDDRLLVAQLRRRQRGCDRQRHSAGEHRHSLVFGRDLHGRPDRDRQQRVNRHRLGRRRRERTADSAPDLVAVTGDRARATERYVPRLDELGLRRDDLRVVAQLR